MSAGQKACHRWHIFCPADTTTNGGIGLSEILIDLDPDHLSVCTYYAIMAATPKYSQGERSASIMKSQLLWSPTPPRPSQAERARSEFQWSPTPPPSSQPPTRPPLNRPPNHLLSQLNSSEFTIHQSLSYS